MLLCIVCLEHFNNIETTPLFIPFLSGSSLKSLIYRETTFFFKGTMLMPDSQRYALNLINKMSIIVIFLASKLLNSYNVLLCARSRNAQVILQRNYNCN